MPLTVTEHASVRLKEMLDGVEHKPEQVLRLVADPSGSLGMAIDTVREDDQVVDHQGAPVMAVGPRLSEQLTGATLDVKETPEGASLVLVGQQ